MLLKAISSAALATAAFLLLGANGNADDHHNKQQFFASFSGFQEIGGLGAGETGAIFSPGQGQLSLNVDNINQKIDFQLTYSGLSAPVTQSHIHFGKRHVAGGIMVFFCANPPIVPPPATQACPTDPTKNNTVTGTIVPASIIGPVPQGVTAGNFAALVAAISSHTAYGNIHTTAFPAGEIRGQIRQRDDEHHQ
jgi:CHRD domain